VVMASLVRSTLSGEHIAGGLVITTVGMPGWRGIITEADDSEIHSAALVTMKVYVPAYNPGMVMLVPEPVVIIPPGFRVKVHIPDAGRPLNTTLPVDCVHVGCVIVPTAGAVGVGGWAGIITLSDGADTHPAAFLSVKLYIPEGSP
jgi:hypothetical protein